MWVSLGLQMVPDRIYHYSAGTAHYPALAASYVLPLRENIKLRQADFASPHAIRLVAAALYAPSVVVGLAPELPHPAFAVHFSFPLWLRGIKLS